MSEEAHPFERGRVEINGTTYMGRDDGCWLDPRCCWYPLADTAMTDKPQPSLILKRARLSRSSGQWGDDDYAVLDNGKVVGRIFHLEASAPEGRPWMWALG